MIKLGRQKEKENGGQRGEHDQPVQHRKQHGCAALSVEFADGLRRHHACAGEEFRVLPVLERLCLQTAPPSGLAFVYQLLFFP